MSRSIKSAVSKFYKQPSTAKAIRAGNLIKSPPNRCKTENSWKTRHFVLYQLNEHEHQLMYFRSSDETDRPIGEIDLTHISVLQFAPQSHDKWMWIEKKFRCAPSCVLHIKSGDRDYFLVGQTSEEMDGWFTDLYEALKNKTHRFHTRKVISKPICRSSSHGVMFNKLSLKSRSFSDPPTKSLDDDCDMHKEEDPNLNKRRASVPGNVEDYYDYPKTFSPSNDGEVCSDNGSGESLYESMTNYSFNQQVAEECDHEVEQLTEGSLNGPCEKKRALSCSVPLCAEGRTNDDSKDQNRSSFGSSDSGVISPVDMQDGKYVHKVDEPSSSPSCSLMYMEKDIEVNQVDLKKHLTLSDQDGRPSVSAWTALPETVCLFQKGDQILAINDLHTSTKEDVYKYLSKLLKNEVKVTILRPRSLHSQNCHCSDLMWSRSANV
ncbi:pleckstrin homology domain-containing family S member 1-like isoform X2 [Gouania willdenowi]|uniref:PH domain-containing protein n=1 Tax=Gouania willdenowi TaxID=441366 RepID=A0A8C5NCX2_GOUWI|nr:pleckstrin homology domain-containing family S member 1 isoform X2 [Gouania willdenowi]